MKQHICFAEFPYEFLRWMHFFGTHIFKTHVYSPKPKPSSWVNDKSPTVQLVLMGLRIIFTIRYMLMEDDHPVMKTHITKMNIRISDFSSVLKILNVNLFR